MAQPKDYDSTLAQMAGSIAAGLVARVSIYTEWCREGEMLTDRFVAEIADTSVQIAKRIIIRARLLHSYEEKER